MPHRAVEPCAFAGRLPCLSQGVLVLSALACCWGPTLFAATEEIASGGTPEAPVAKVPPRADSDVHNRHPMYHASSHPARTLRATKEAYQQWKSRQAVAARQVRFEGWSWVAVDDASASEELSRNGPEGVSHLALQTIEKLADDTIVEWAKAIEGAPKLVLLHRTLHADQPVTLTVGVGGGTHLAVALNGSTLLAGASSRIERFGTDPNTQDDPVLDRFLVDLPLQAGANHLVIAVQQGHPRRKVFAFTREVHPVQRFWDWLWHDFPSAKHPLMDRVPASWMGSDTMAPSRLRDDLQQMQARQYRTTTPELSSGRPYTESFSLARPVDRDPIPETDRKEGLLHDGWFDAEGFRFEQDFLTACGEPLPPSGADAEAWLRACATAAHRAELRESLASVGKAIEALAEKFSDYPAEAFRQRAGKILEAVNAADQINPEWVAGSGLDELRREALVSANPLLKGRTLVYAKRHTYNSHHCYDDYNHGIRSFEGNLLVRDLETGAERALFPQLDGGVFDRFDVSHDGRRVAIGYRRPFEGGFRIYEGAVDGSWVRQVTFAPEDEAERVRRHSEFPIEMLLKQPTLHGHWSDDVHPCYLPDGGIAFVSTRPEYSIYCGVHETMVTTVHRVERDGSKLEQLSNSALSELFPVLLENGRILYTRYEYVFKGNLNVHGLWSMLPDGRLAEEVYGNNIPVPPTHAYGRPVPGREDLVAYIGCSHETRVGSVEMVDLTKDRRTPAAALSLTPETSSYGISNRQFRNGRWVYRDIYGPAWQDPYPLDENFLLVSGNPDERLTDPSAYGIWLMDRFGNRVPLVQDPDISCFQPMILEPRSFHQTSKSGIQMTSGPSAAPAARPASYHAPSAGQAPASQDKSEPAPQPTTSSKGVMPTVYSRGMKEEAVIQPNLPIESLLQKEGRSFPPNAGDPPRKRGGIATLLLADVARGLEGVAKEAVKYIRIFEQVARSWDATNRLGSESFPGSATSINMGGHIWVAVDHGIVPVESDGSASFTVPADENIYLQVLGENYMAIQTMRTFVNLRPGEVRSCMGCHDDRRSAPPNAGELQALKRPPSQPQPLPGMESVPRPIHFEKDVQPILTKNCVSCHSGEGTAANLDLRDEPFYHFNRAYTELMQKGFLKVIQEHRMATAWLDPQKRFDYFAGMEHAATMPPYSFGAAASPLTRVLNDKVHRHLLSKEERIALISWMDANAQYHGSYFGYRDDRRAGHSDWRTVPDLDTARGKPSGITHPMPESYLPQQSEVTR